MLAIENNRALFVQWFLTLKGVQLDAKDWVSSVHVPQPKCAESELAIIVCFLFFCFFCFALLVFVVCVVAVVFLSLPGCSCAPDSTSVTPCTMSATS